MRQLHLPMRIWDLPIRLFHWSLVTLIVFSWVTYKQSWMEWHALSGYAILSLLLFRVAWGFIGSDTARFTFFLKSPLEALRHLSHLHRREPDTEIGHNAAGGWMVLAMLGLLFAQAITGLCSNDDISVEGPLARSLGKDLSDQITSLHHLGYKLLLIMVAMHILAIITYAVLKSHNLVRPMITGKKRLPGATRAPRIVSPILAAAVYAVAVAMVVALVRFAP
jgi:cytochrome b